MNEELFLAVTNAEIAERNGHFASAIALLQTVDISDLTEEQTESLQGWINRLKLRMQ